MNFTGTSAELKCPFRGPGDSACHRVDKHRNTAPQESQTTVHGPCHLPPQATAKQGWVRQHDRPVVVKHGGEVTGALGQTLFPCPCRTPATQSRGTQNQNHGACGPLRPAQPEPAVPPGAFPAPCSSPVTPHSILRSSGEKSSSP